MGDDLLALAERVAKLTGPDREVDGLIAEYAFGWKPARVGPDYDGNNDCEVLTPDGRLIEGFAYPNRGVIHRAYHCDDYTRDCRDTAFPRDAVRKQLAASLRALARQREG